MSLRQSLIWLVVLIIALVALIAWNAGLFNLHPQAPVETPMTELRLPPPAPAVTKERTVQAMDSQQKMFSIIISYTDQGFEPKAAVIKKGDVARFVNNSTHTMWITTAGKTCGKGVLDTCKALPPGEYWEYEFKTVGSFMYTEQGTRAEGSVKVE